MRFRHYENYPAIAPIGFSSSTYIQFSDGYKFPSFLYRNSRKMWPKIILTVLCLRGFFCIMDCKMVVEFSRSRNLTQGTIFGCPKHVKEKIQLSKCLMRKYLRFFLVNIESAPEILGMALEKKHHHLAVLVDGDCENIDNFLSEHIDKHYFYETYRWLVIASESKSIFDVLRPLKLNINSELHVAIQSGDKTFAVFDVYNPASDHGGELKISPLGFYDEIHGYRAEYEGNKYWARRNMTGVKFTTAVVIPSTIHQPLMEYLRSDENRQIDSMHRFQSVTVDHCRDIYNFSLDTLRTHSWGYIQENGRFDGLVSLLENKRIDFGSSPLLFKLDRMPYVDYSYGNWILRSTFIFRRPKVVAKSYEIFLRPLNVSVWTTILVILLAILIFLRIIFSHELRIFRRKFSFFESSWSFLILFTLGAFCQQGATCYPNLYSSRIISVFVFLFCILVYQFYSASIVSYLLMDPPRTIFDLEDLLKSPLRVGIEDILIDRNYFVQTTDANAIELFSSKIKGETNSSSGFYRPVEGLALVRGGGFAYHVETSTAYPIVEATFSNQEICELDEVQMYRTQPMHANLQKLSPFKEMMNFCMLKLVETGNMDRLRKHWDARKPTCMESAKKREIHVGLSEFSCSPLALTAGVIISMVFLVVEFAVFFKKRIYDFLKLRLKFTNHYTVYPYAE